MKKLFFVSLSIIVSALVFAGDAFSSQYTGGPGDGWYSLESTDFFLGGPNVSLASSANQLFIVGQSKTDISSLTITDSTGGAITALNDIRVRIPSAFNMEWYTLDTTATAGGTASAKASSTVSYAGSNKILVIDVTSNFSAGEYITVSGLSFTNFSAVSAADNLELDIYNSGLSYSVDSKSIQIKSASSAPFIGGSGDGWSVGASSDISPFLAAPGSPIAYWRFDEGSGTTVYDDSTGDNDGNLTLGSLGNTTVANAWATGKFGNCLSFDGTDDYVDCGNSSLGGSFTVSCWVKPSSIATDWTGFVSKNDTSGEKVFWLGQHSSDGYIRFGVYLDGDTETSLDTDSAVIANGNWYHIAASYDGNYQKIYVNGVLVKTSSDLNTLQQAGTSNYWIGKSTSAFFNGFIDDARIYSYARTADQIMIDYNQGFGAALGAGTKGVQEVAYFRFDEATTGPANGQTIYDDTATNNGTANYGTNASGMSWTTGKFGGALSFDGDDYVQVNDNNSLDLDQTFTLEAWVKLDVITGANRFIATKKGDTGEGLYSLIVFSDGKVGVEFYSAGYKTAKSTTTLTTGSWYHIAGVRDGATQKVYINGVEDTLSEGGSFTGAVANSSSLLYIGRDAGATQFVDGTIDEVRIYNYARSGDQIMVDYNQGAAVVLGAGEKRTGPLGYWRMDKPAGTTVAYDDTSSDADGTLTNMDVDTCRVQGKFGRAIQFDGTDDYLNIPNNASLNITTNALSISAWIYTTTTNDQTIINKWGDGASSQAYSLEISGGKATFKIYTTAEKTVQSSSAIPTDQWVHVAGIYDAAEMRIYENRVLKGTTPSVTGNIQTNVGVVRFGARTDNTTARFQGKMDEVRIYNYARTEGENSVDSNGGAAVWLR